MHVPSASSLLLTYLCLLSPTSALPTPLSLPSSSSDLTTSTSPNHSLPYQLYTPPPSPETPSIKQLATEDSPETFALGCSITGFPGGSSVVHWLQKDGSCKSRLEVRTRGLFMKVDGKDVVVGEEGI